MKQSSLEWFNQEAWRLRIQLESKEITLGEFATKYYTLFEQAKAMHKEEIHNTYEQGLEDGYHFDGSRSDWESEGMQEYMAEQYYNKTFPTK
jgi:hypothetical protein